MSDTTVPRVALEEALAIAEHYQDALKEICRLGAVGEPGVLDIRHAASIAQRALDAKEVPF